MPTLAEIQNHRENQEQHRHYGALKFLKPEAVAARLDVPLSTIYEMARQNRIGGVVRAGRLVRFNPNKLEAWIEAGGQALPGGWRQEEQK